MTSFGTGRAKGAQGGAKGCWAAPGVRKKQLFLLSKREHPPRWAQCFRSPVLQDQRLLFVHTHTLEVCQAGPRCLVRCDLGSRTASPPGGPPVKASLLSSPCCGLEPGTGVLWPGGGRGSILDEVCRVCHWPSFSFEFMPCRSGRNS